MPESGTQTCERSTDNCMTDARKYRKMSYLVMFRKAEKRSWIHIQNPVNTKI